MLFDVLLIVVLIICCGTDLYEQIEEYARSKVDSVEVSISPTDESLRKPGTFVTVILDVKLDYVTPFASAILPSPFHAKAESTMRVE